ncbi:hypothetical protein KC322_g100 [Hortaea werneckii]|nr:hypothetical protein KC322_g100 [Hortaea werneckii]
MCQPAHFQRCPIGPVFGVSERDIEEEDSEPEDEGVTPEELFVTFTPGFPGILHLAAVVLVFEEGQDGADAAWTEAVRFSLNSLLLVNFSSLAMAWYALVSTLTLVPFKLCPTRKVLLAPPPKVAQFDSARWGAGEVKGELDLPAVVGRNLRQDDKTADLAFLGGGVVVLPMRHVLPRMHVRKMDLLALSVVQPILHPLVNLFLDFLRHRLANWDVVDLDALFLGVTALTLNFLNVRQSNLFASVSSAAEPQSNHNGFSLGVLRAPVFSSRQISNLGSSHDVFEASPVAEFFDRRLVRK